MHDFHTRRCRSLAVAALALGVATFGRAPAHAQPKLVLKADGALRITPDMGASRHVLSIRSKGGVARNVRITVAGFHDLRLDAGVSTAPLQISPDKISRLTRKGKEIALVVREPNAIATGMYKLTLVARGRPGVKTRATLRILTGPPGSVSLSPAQAEYSTRDRWPWKECIPFGDPCRRAYSSQAISLVVAGEGGGYVRDATLSITELVNVETERSVAGARFAGAGLVVTEVLGSDQLAEVPVELPDLPEPGIYNLRVTAESPGTAVVAESNVRIVVSDGPALAAVVLGLGVFLSFLVTSLRARRSRVMSERKAGLFDARVESWIRVHEGHSNLPLVRTLRGSRSQVEFIAGSQGAAAADEYLRELQNVYSALEDAVSHLDRLGRLGGRLQDALAAAAILRSGPVTVPGLDAAVDAASEIASEVDSETERVLTDLMLMDYEHQSKDVANAAAKLKKLAEGKADLVGRAAKALSALERTLARPVYEILAEHESSELEAAGYPPSETPREAGKVHVVVEPPLPRAEEAAVFRLKPVSALPMDPPVWSIRKGGEDEEAKTLLAVLDDVFDVALYEFPEKGKYSVTVESGGTTIAETTVEVRRSTAAEQRGKVFRIDASLSLVSFLFALVTGMWIFYYREGIAYFGAPQHYIELFLWGIGIDTATKSLRGVRDRVERGAEPG